MTIREGFTFDDVLLVPKFSDITSRSQTDLSTNISRNIKLNIPLVSANMDTVTESTMATTMARQGGIGIIHRFLTIEEEANQVLKVKRSGSVMIDNPYQISVEKSIEDGSLHSFEGPIYNQAGELVVAEGEVADDGMLAGMMFYVQGIEGDIPQ